MQASDGGRENQLIFLDEVINRKFLNGNRFDGDMPKFPAPCELVRFGSDVRLEKFPQCIVHL